MNLSYSGFWRTAAAITVKCQRAIHRELNCTDAGTCCSYAGMTGVSTLT